jgi:hypothetical protein
MPENVLLSAAQQKTPGQPEKIQQFNASLSKPSDEFIAKSSRASPTHQAKEAHTWKK